MNQVGYLVVKVVNNTTLTSSGNLLLNITHFTLLFQRQNKLITFNINNSGVNINFYYNSAQLLMILLFKLIIEFLILLKQKTFYPKYNRL